MRGRQTTLTIQMSRQTRATLHKWLQRRKTPLGRAKRAQAMLLLEQGHSYTHTAKRVGLTERNLRKWAKRFHSQGVAGLDEKSRWLCCKYKADLLKLGEKSERGLLHEQPEPKSLQVASLPS